MKEKQFRDLKILIMYSLLTILFFQMFWYYSAMGETVGIIVSGIIGVFSILMSYWTAFKS